MGRKKESCFPNQPGCQNCPLNGPPQVPPFLPEEADPEGLLVVAEAPGGFD